VRKLLATDETDDYFGENMMRREMGRVKTTKDHQDLLVIDKKKARCSGGTAVRAK